MFDCGNPVLFFKHMQVDFKTLKLLIGNTVKIYVTEPNLVFQKTTNAFLLRPGNFF